MSIFVWKPTAGAPVAYKPKVRIAQFGDGYAQRSPNGINNNPEAWSLTFDGITNREADAIIAFLKARGGTQAFNWVNLNMENLLYTCDQWDRKYSGEDSCSISATFNQFYG